MIIGICGGIGSGKSVVSRILRLRGEAVYDCDLEARLIMDSSEEVLSALNSRYGSSVCPPEGPICRPELARRVFSDDEERLWLNSLVHRLVREDVRRWATEIILSGRKRCFVESAILATSGLDAMCSEVWVVTAPDDVRIARVKDRDGLSEDAIRQRMQSQEEEVRLLKARGESVKMIVNDGEEGLLEQIS